MAEIIVLSLIGLFFGFLLFVTALGSWQRRNEPKAETYEELRKRRGYHHYRVIDNEPEGI